MAKSKGSNRGRKKKRVAAHIKEAAGKRTAALSAGEGDDNRAPLLAAPLGVGRPKRPREPEAVPKAENPAREEWDRLEAIEYLTAWLSARGAKQAADEGAVASAGGAWKFNKKTQSWLLRRMFFEDEIGETDFGTLCLYLEGLKGAGRQRVLAQAQEIIDKHGPDEGEEQTAAEREAASAAVLAATTKETVDVDETEQPTAEATTTSVPSGYNSDSSREDEGADSEGGGGVGDKQKEGTDSATGAIQSSTATESNAGGGAIHSDDDKKVFAFGFSGVDTAAADGIENSSSEDDDDDDDNEGEKSFSKPSEAVPAAAVVVAAAKKPRTKARSALTGLSKAEAKSKAAAAAYERALQVAEVLS